MPSAEQTGRAWYEASYAHEGFRAQRLYPNEELLRFLGREFFSRPEAAPRHTVRVLELGCGAGSNLWMIAREGFAAHGVDISTHALALGHRMLAHWGVAAALTAGSITHLPYPAAYFDVVVDVFSAYCLPEREFALCLDEVQRVLKPGGKFFSYSPSTASQAFIDYAPATKLDAFTLSGIKRPTSPYAGNDYPFRFISPEHYEDLLAARGFRVTYLEQVARTYRRLQETFAFITIVGEKTK